MAKKVRTKVKEIELDEFTQYLLKFQSVLNRGSNHQKVISNCALKDAKENKYNK
ncbi:MAG: hypothetical protein Q4F05_02475 [bacterium]|nr:hypothetical protein [bacterium]